MTTNPLKTGAQSTAEMLCILTLLSRFNPVSAGAGIAVPSVTMFKCYVGSLSRPCNKCMTCRQWTALLNDTPPYSHEEVCM